MHQEDHDVDCLDHPHHRRHLRGCVPSVKGSGEGIISQDTIDAENCGPAFDSQENVDNFKWKNTEDIRPEVPVFHVIPSAQLSAGFINSTLTEEHQPRFDHEDVIDIDKITDIIT